MATHMRAELVVDALSMAIHNRKPKNVIHHSDQGSQYRLRPRMSVNSPSESAIYESSSALA
jgi:transposase InsO family protein